MLQKEEAQARGQIWKYVFGYIETSAVKSAIDLGLPDIIERHGAPISLSDLSSAVDLPPGVLHRIMRFLTHHGIFQKADPPGKHNPNDDVSSVRYTQTPLSRLLRSDSLGPFVQLQGYQNGPSGCISAEGLRGGRSRPGLEYSGSDKLYDDPTFGMRVFRDAMAAHARFTTAAIVDYYGREGFEGVGSVVDVGGSYGMALGMLVEAFPWVRGICFDLPEVVAMAAPVRGIEFVGGSMFQSVPKADAVMLMFVLHNWSDEECITILKKCKEAVPAGTGKVIIVDAIIDEDGEGDEFTGGRLALDLTMMAVTLKGKERTYKEWTYILQKAGFRRHAIKNIKAIESIIEAYP